jgi:hypothetical protein
MTFARDWIAAWNSHELERIAAHYAADVEYASPFVPALTGTEGGTLRGLPAVREYIARGLATFPELRFELLDAYLGQNSVVVHYRSVRELTAAETFEFDAAGKIRRVLCHYRENAHTDLPHAVARD